MRPMAPPGSGSNINPTMTPAKSAKKYHACCANADGGGISAMMIATATGAKCFHVSFRPLSLVPTDGASARDDMPSGPQAHDPFDVESFLLEQALVVGDQLGQTLERGGRLQYEPLHGTPPGSFSPILHGRCPASYLTLAPGPSARITEGTGSPPLFAQ